MSDWIRQELIMNRMTSPIAGIVGRGHDPPPLSRGRVIGVGLGPAGRGLSRPSNA